MMRALWAGGRHVRFSALQVTDHPVNVPIFLGGSAEKALARAARLGLVLWADRTWVGPTLSDRCAHLGRVAQEARPVTRLRCLAAAASTAGGPLSGSAGVGQCTGRRSSRSARTSAAGRGTSGRSSPSVPRAGSGPECACGLPHASRQPVLPWRGLRVERLSLLRVRVRAPRLDRERGPRSVSRPSAAARVVRPWRRASRSQPASSSGGHRDRCGP